MNIVIIEQNKIYRESLKTALDQIPDFKVVRDMGNDHNLEEINKDEVHLILIDCSLGKTICIETIKKAISFWPNVRFLFLINYKEECNFNYVKTIDLILKNSTKKEFEDKIRKQQSTEKSTSKSL